LGVSSQAISQWNRCPAERVLAVEAASEGAVSRHELRPDIYPCEEEERTPAKRKAEHASAKPKRKKAAPGGERKTAA